MGKNNNRRPLAQAPVAKGDKAKADKAKSSGPVPVPIKKVPSLNGKHSLPLHAAGSFLRAPSPSKLPPPPASWATKKPPSAARCDGSGASSSALPVPSAPVVTGVGLERSAAVVTGLHGNLLMLTLAPRFPPEVYGDLAGKITGMLLEGLDIDEINGVLGSEQSRDEYVREALEVLSDAGDQRAMRALAPPPPVPQRAGGPLTVEVGAAGEAAIDDVTIASTGLTPSLAALVRMSPRVSANKYQTKNILGFGVLPVAPP